MLRRLDTITNEIGPRTGSVSILKPHPDFKAFINGTSQLTRAVDLSLETWFTPIENFNTKDFNKFFKGIKQVTYDWAAQNTLINQDRTIVISDMCKDGILEGKSTYLQVDVTLYLTKELYVKDEAIIKLMEELKLLIINKMEKHPKLIFSKMKV